MLACLFFLGVNPSLDWWRHQFSPSECFPATLEPASWEREGSSAAGVLPTDPTGAFSPLMLCPEGAEVISPSQPVVRAILPPY